MSFVTEVPPEVTLISTSEWSFSIGINRCIAMVSVLHRVDLKPLQALFHSLLVLAQCVFANNVVTHPCLQHRD